ncbi:hypothetical protein Bca52824_039854 [Brassica carinata]|uniref:Uncharacterized protein n=1 Tax=Brassica carinata TaxID=52824 RepID=A0A8X7RUE9_BRACI|nr:hypothetical protein Bca52824_039854 [Brassica carinata]
MLDSLIALKDFQGVDGLPPLSEIENIRREKSSKNLQELRQNSRFERRLPNQASMSVRLMGIDSDLVLILGYVSDGFFDKKLESYGEEEAWKS